MESDSLYEPYPTGQPRMTTWAICLTLAILSIFVALTTSRGSDWVTSADWGLFDLSTVECEGFYRALLIHWSFAGLAIAAGFGGAADYARFRMFFDPVFAVIANLTFGIFVAVALDANFEDPISAERRRWIAVCMAIGIALFVYSAVTATNLTPLPAK